jgi:malate dehydrogenase
MRLLRTKERTKEVSMITVVITGAAGQIGYSLLPIIASGQVFGPDTTVHLRLLEIPQGLSMLQGVKMELDDCAYDLLGDVLCTTDPLAAFQDADYAFLVGGFPRRPGMLRKDLIQMNTTIFLSMGQAIEAVASANIKVLVVANPANTNALVTMKQCTRVPSKNFCAMTRLDYNRASSQVAFKLGTSVKNIKNIIIWGNHSATQYPDPTTDGYLADVDGTKTESLAMLLSAEEEWLRGAFVSTVQQRGKEVMNARGKSSALSAANAAADCMKTWRNGTKQGETVAMAVYNEQGHYGVDSDVFFSFPCECKNGDWIVKTGLEISEYSQEKIKTSEIELVEERMNAMEILSSTSDGGGEGGKKE